MLWIYKYYWCFTNCGLYIHMVTIKWIKQFVNIKSVNYIKQSRM